jgi:type IV pilus assembly protein PilX
MRLQYRTAVSRIRPCGAPSPAWSQRGIALMVVLIALVLMSLAAVGLVRTVDTGNLVVGNLAFKQSTTSAADGAAEVAINWLQLNGTAATLLDNDTTNGYYATSLTELDVSGKSSNASRVLVDWDGNNCAYAAAESYTLCITPSNPNSTNDYTTRYVITRVCITTGAQNATGNGCAKPVSNVSDNAPKKGELKYGDDKRFAAPPGPYYRIIVRSEGPRKTVSFTETYVHF